MQSKEVKGVPTGRLPKPKKPTAWPDLEKIGKKALALCKETQTDVVVYVDERQSVTYRSVNDARTMERPSFVLYSIRWQEVKRRKS